MLFIRVDAAFCFLPKQSFLVFLSLSISFFFKPPPSPSLSSMSSGARQEAERPIRTENALYKAAQLFAGGYHLSEPGCPPYRALSLSRGQTRGGECIDSRHRGKANTAAARWRLQKYKRFIESEPDRQALLMPTDAPSR